MRVASVLIAGLALVVAGTASNPVRADEVRGDVGRGAKVYGENCGRCHNPRSPIEHLDRDWSIVIQHMRVIGGLPGQQARDVEAYLRASNNPPPPAPEAAAQPRTLTISGADLVARYGCRGCHTIRGEGGKIAPKLDDVFSRRSEEWVRAQLRNPRQHNPRSIMPVFGLSEEQIDAIVEYLRGSR